MAGIDETHPEISSEWHPTLNGQLSPSEVEISSKSLVWWQCEKGHAWQTAVRSRRAGSGCPYCARKRFLPGFNDFESTYPQFTSMWSEKKNQLPPSEVSAGDSVRKFWFTCELGHDFQSKPNQFARRIGTNANGCPFCDNKKVLEGFNDLLSQSPDIAAEWHPQLNGDVSPSQVINGSGKKYWWRCREDSRHEWLAKVVNRMQGYGCPVCAGQAVQAGVNDLASQNPDLAKEWHPRLNGDARPQAIHVNSARKFWWQCLVDNRHEWIAQVNSRTRTGCPICSHRKIVPGINDLATESPELGLELDDEKNGFSATQIGGSGARMVWWKCGTCNSSWRATLSNRRSNKSGCPSCAKGGYDPKLPGYLYLLSKPGENYQQFGISNFPESRLNQHKKWGWQVVDVVGPTDGYWTANTELALKRFFGNKGLILKDLGVEKFEGYTESWDSTEIMYPSISRMLEALRAEEWEK